LIATLVGAVKGPGAELLTDTVGGVVSVVPTVTLVLQDASVPPRVSFSLVSKVPVFA